ncbi:transcriptional regulator ExuR [Yersinia aleksiciae]|uniref:transcriptional regulator ExuR n=1 Tax=Yersinia aleksiciae TaxID=263819 RepID=UPI00119E80CD|nr:transcriptional regulator ExuR [Yersinia aleksiciae]MDN0122107.1 transcriptional regulator ExuR [Yersinia aleksiciae]
MEFTETRRLYQQLAAELKQRIEAGVYPVGDKLPAERYISEEMNVSRTVVREAIIMLEVEGYVEVRKGSGIHVMSNKQKHLVMPNQGIEFATAGPFELLQARQLIESNIAEFAATQVTRQDIVQLIEIQKHARQEDRFRDSQWDLKFHVQVALATQNTAMATIVEKMWSQRVHNPYWLKLHEHIDDKSIESWCEDHDRILEALMRKDPYASKLAMWQHLENTKQMLFRATTDDFEFNVDRYLFTENPVVHLDIPKEIGVAGRQQVNESR